MTLAPYVFQICPSLPLAHEGFIQVAVRAKHDKEKDQRKKIRDAAKGVQEDRLPSALDIFRR